MSVRTRSTEESVNGRDDASSEARAQRRRIADQESPPNQESPSNQESLADDLICPITLELPLEPVTAEDGCIYERSAIEAHFASRQGMSLQSPFTNQPMGNKLLPSVRTKNMIDRMIKNGMIKGDLADQWKDKKANAEIVQLITEKAGNGDGGAMLQLWFEKAGNGDSDAMLQLGHLFDRGENGLPQDHSKALHWYEKSYSKGNATATAKIGEYYLKGLGGAEKSTPTGIMCLSMAAVKGSRLAVYLLADHSNNLSPKKSDIVLYHLKKCLSGEGLKNDLKEEHLNEARKMLESFEE